MTDTFAPIAFFAFNRPAHTARTLTALAKNAEAINTDLHIFVDGPRDDNERTLVAEVLRVASAARGFRNVEIHPSTSNRGLYLSITGGVTQLMVNASRVIVIEDDILVSSSFLKYMNNALEYYADDPRIGSIHGYAPPIEDLPDFFFLRGGDCWGWATWTDRWALFNSDAHHILKALVRRGELQEFSTSQGIQNLRHLIRRSRNRNQSWAAHWNASLFLESRLTLHPGTSFVQNIGNDGTGTHSKISKQYATSVRRDFVSIPPTPVQHDGKAARMLRDFYDAKIIFPLIGRFARSSYLALLRAQARILCIARRSSETRTEKDQMRNRGRPHHD
jgi:hypothetical protein